MRSQVKATEKFQELLQLMPNLRVALDKKERILYDHDVGEIPPLVKALTGNNIPDMVIQPENEEQVILIIKWCQANRLTVTPRGAATAGYGGAVPTRGGVVLELVRMNRILGHDKKKNTVTIEPGVVWNDLESHLINHDLALRLMPTSAPGSTVGGWVAQGGSGLGGYQYGWLRDNLEEVRVVYPDGKAENLTGNDLDFIYGAMGTTGIITRVTLKVCQAGDQSIRLASFETSRQLQNFLTGIQELELTLWHVGFINPTAAFLKGKVPPKEHHGHVKHRRQLPEKYLLTLALAGDGPGARSLENALEKAGGTFLSDEEALEEWKERFSPMKVKRLGPSLIPMEFVIPLPSLAAFLGELNTKIKLPLVIEATVVKGGHVIILGFIPHDIRSLKFNLAYGLSLFALKAARKAGGRAYGTGLYLPRETPLVHGRKLSLWQNLKRQRDKARVMNPGKLEGKTFLKALVKLVSLFEPVVRNLANTLGKPSERSLKDKGGIPGELIKHAYSCAQCGYCRKVCTLYEGRGWESSSPRGKWYLLRLVAQGKARLDQDTSDTFLMCTTCERCDYTCQLDTPVEPSWGAMRGKLVNSGAFRSFPAFEMMAASLRNEKNIWANYRKDRAAWIPHDLSNRLNDHAKTAYFAGCTASFVEKDIAQASLRLLLDAGQEVTYLGEEEACCGIPMLVAGRWDVFEEILRHNINAMKKKDISTIVTSCPACWLSWKTYYPEWAKKLGIDFPFQTKHYSEIVAEAITSGKLQLKEPVDLKLTFHDSCHIGRAGGVYDPPRELLQAIPGVTFVEMEHNRENALCCGSVLTRISEPVPTSDVLGGTRLQEAVAAGADAVVALCPCCQFQLRVSAEANGINMPVLDLAAVTARSLGYNLPDPTPYALEMWSVFEAMINLMQVPAMAGLMIELLPQMVKAMPGYLQAAMKTVRYVPGMALVMKPLMPRMMPLLMPGVMPKVMPHMLRAIEKRVNMPEFMKNQMPDMLPMVMDYLMPHMLPEIARIITPDMIRYLKRTA